MDDTGTLRIEDLLTHQAWVRSLARALVSSPDRAGDVEQETWVAALRSPPPAGRDARAWLRVVARNAARLLHRSESRRARWEAAAPAAPGAESPAAAVERVELRRRLAAAVVRLEEPARTAVVLRYFEELTPSEIAARLRVNASTVRSRIASGLARLREFLDEEHGGDRRAWAVALLGYLPRRSSFAATAAGALVMSTKWKILLGFAVLLAVAGISGWSTFVSPSRGPSPATPPPPTPVPPVEVATEEEPEPPAAVAEVPPGRNVLENDVIAGRILFPDGRPAAGMPVRWRIEERLPVEHPSGAVFSDVDGEFSIPAVRGAPYSVLVHTESLRAVLPMSLPPVRYVRGGSKGLHLEVPPVTFVPIRLRETENGEAVPEGSARLSWWTRGTRRGSVASLPKGAKEDPDGELRLYLPVASEVDEGGLEVEVSAPGYESASFSLLREELGPGGLPPRTIRLRKLPAERFLLVAEVPPSGTATPAKATAVVLRGDERVWRDDADVIDGVARFPGVPFAGDRVLAVAGSCVGSLPLPGAAGAEASLRLAEPAPFEVTVETALPPGPMGQWIQADVELGTCRVDGTTITGFGRGRLRVVIRDRHLRYLGTEVLEVEPGHRYTLRPDLPAEGSPPKPPPTPPAPPAPEPFCLDSSGTGTGTVTRRASIAGMPLPGAVARLARYAEPGDDPEAANFLEVETDDDGRFAFQRLAAGRYLLLVSPEELPPKKEEIALLEGERNEPLEFDWPAGGGLTVKVLDDRGEPVRGAYVRIENIGSHWTTEKYTDADGGVEFDRLAPGWWNVSIPGKGQEMRTAKEVSKGATAEVTFGGASGLEGTVLGPDGHPLAGATVWVRPVPGEAGSYTGTRTSGRTDAGGRYRVHGLSPGRYEARVQVNSATAASFVLVFGRAEVFAGETAKLDGRIADTEISGTLRWEENGKPLGRYDARISVYELDPRTGKVGPEVAGAFTAPDGTWKVPGLRPGRYRLLAASARVRDRTSDAYVTLPADGVLEDVTLTLPGSGD